MKNYFPVRTSALLFIISLFLFTAPLQSQTFRFIVFGDSQFQNPGVFEEKVREAELLKPAFVLHVGDMIHGYTYNPEGASRQWERFGDQISPLTMPFYPTPGNHDVTTKEIQPAYIDMWGEDRLFYSFDYDDTHIIVLNTYLNQIYDSIPPVELKWLKEDLEKAKEKKHIFVSTHSPLYFSMKGGWDKVHELFTRYPVRAVFTGHSHRYDYRLIDGIAYFCLVTSGNIHFNNHLAGLSHHFVQVNVQNDKVDYAVLTDDAVYPPDAVHPDELGRSRHYYEPDKTVIISDPSKAALDTTLTITLVNGSDTVRDYTVRWMTDDYRWQFEPFGSNITIPPESEKKLEFRIHAEQDSYLRTELPYLLVTAPYESMLGYWTETEQKVSLFYPPEISVHRIEEEIQLDGKPVEDVWRQSGIENLEKDASGTPAPEETRVTLLYDDTFLYVGIIGAEPNPEGLAAFAYGEIPLVFGDDDFELFFDTNRDMRSFYRLMVNPAETVLHSGPGGLWSFNYKVRTFVSEDSWSAEFKIPFSELKSTTPEKGTVWGFNVRRHRQQADYIQSDWSKMRTHPPYQPEYFGLIKFK